MGRTTDPGTALEIVADLLANLHDWDSEDPRAEFLAVAEENQAAISGSVLAKVFDEFFALDSVERYSARFDHRAFVEMVTSG